MKDNIIASDNCEIRLTHVDGIEVVKSITTLPVTGVYLTETSESDAMIFEKGYTYVNARYAVARQLANHIMDNMTHSKNSSLGKVSHRFEFKYLEDLDHIEYKRMIKELQDLNEVQQDEIYNHKIKINDIQKMSVFAFIIAKIKKWK